MIISGDDPASKGAQRFEVFTGAGKRRDWPPEVKASIVAECYSGREGGLTSPREITKPILERYQRHLFLYRKANGEPLSVRSQNVRTTPIKALFKWLSRGNHSLYNPASELELPRMEKRLPRHVLSAREVEKVLSLPDIATAIGLRDRAMLKVLYSTGIRRMELINLSLTDIDADRGTLLVRQGKGRKDRMIPIGERALHWVQRYRREVRPDFACGAVPDHAGRGVRGGADDSARARLRHRRRSRQDRFVPSVPA
ncbi:MAG: tyrosine-type recombinase/integrase [Novosphingobium sp.]